MKKIFLLLFGIAVSLPAYADNLACKNCGASGGNVIFVCEGAARHQSCSRCADSIGKLEGLNDDTDLSHKFAEVWTGDKVGKLLARCPHVTVNEAYGEIKKIPCQADIRKIVHDNRKQKNAAGKKTAKKKGKTAGRKSSPKVPCKKCGVSSGNIIYLCSDSKHVSCNLCAHKVGGMEGMNDDTDIARQFADVLNGTKTGKLLAKCPHEVLKETANKKEMVPCLSPIRQILNDNRDEEVIKAEQDAKDAEQEKAAIELAAGQKKIKKEHAELQAAFDSAVKNKDLKKLAELVDKMYSHYVVHENYTADFERKRTRRKSDGAEDVLMEIQAEIYDVMFNKTEPECYIMDQIPKIALECKNDDMIMALLNQDYYKDRDALGKKYNGRMAMYHFPDNYLESAIKTGQAAFVELFREDFTQEHIFGSKNPAVIKKYIDTASADYYFHGLDCLEREFYLLYIATCKDMPASVWDCTLKNATQQEKNIALAVATAKNNEKLVDYLLANGAKADTRIRIRDRRITLYPYHIALSNGNVPLAKKLKFNPGLHDTYLPCEPGKKKIYILQFVIEQKQLASVKYLIEEEKLTPNREDVELARKLECEEIEKHLEEKCSFMDSSLMNDTPLLLVTGIVKLPVMILEKTANNIGISAAGSMEIEWLPSKEYFPEKAADKESQIFTALTGM